MAAGWEQGTFPEGAVGRKTSPFATVMLSVAAEQSTPNLAAYNLFFMVLWVILAYSSLVLPGIMPAAILI